MRQRYSAVRRLFELEQRLVDVEARLCEAVGQTLEVAPAVVPTGNEDSTRPSRDVHSRRLDGPLSGVEPAAWAAAPPHGLAAVVEHEAPAAAPDRDRDRSAVGEVQSGLDVDLGDPVVVCFLVEPRADRPATRVCDERGPRGCAVLARDDVERVAEEEPLVGARAEGSAGSLACVGVVLRDRTLERSGVPTE